MPNGIVEGHALPDAHIMDKTYNQKLNYRSGLSLSKNLILIGIPKKESTLSNNKKRHRAQLHMLHMLTFPCKILT